MATSQTPAAEPALLDGFAVLDLSSVGPAARASRWLADYGARVIKVGPPASRQGVQIRPPFHSYGGGRGMERIQIDLKAEAGREAFLRLAASADVVIESYRPGVVDRLGIGYEAVRALNPRVVYCSTTGYGQHGEHANWAGHDINYLAMGGFLACCEPRADGGPPLPGATVADSAGGGLQAVVAILAALLRRSVSGSGRYLDVSAAEGVLSLMSLAIDEHLATGDAPTPGSSLLLGRYACYDLYRARDGKWLSVGAIEPRFYTNLCKALGLDSLAGAQLDDDRQDEIRAAFQGAFMRRDRDDWVAELAPADTCVAPVYSIPELVEDPHLRSRSAFLSAQHPEAGEFRQLGPLLAGGIRDQPLQLLRAHGETDAPELLREVGFSADEIDALRTQGVVE